ncbi:MAG: hypothetical protein ACLQBY_09790 [Solirubrobacteraceae bacterium]
MDLLWMPAHAPYMPIATVGLLALLAEREHEATAYWSDDPSGAPALHVDTSLGVAEVAQLIADAPWPQLKRIEWPAGSWSQGLKPTLKGTGEPARAFRDLVASAPPLEKTLLRAILTDGVLDNDGVPGRSRLLRGVKSDLSSIAERPKRITADGLAAELRDGPDFPSGKSGLGLGLVPEVQTFGGTTGPDASTVGACSTLLYLLLWRGIMALPPVPVLRGARRMVGGPLVTQPDVLSWPRWRMPLGLRALRTLLSLGAIHQDEPDLHYLTERGIDAVYRARAVPLNNMVAVFRWGEQVMRAPGGVPPL